MPIFMKGIPLSAHDKALLSSSLIRGSAGFGDGAFKATSQGLEGGSQWQNDGAIVHEPPTSAASQSTPAKRHINRNTIYIVELRKMGPRIGKLRRNLGCV